MPVTPIQRLQCALKARPRRDRPSIARAAGVGPTALARAAAGQDVRADAYLKICAGLGIDSRTGEASPSRRLGDLNWKMLGLAIELRRRVRKLGSQRHVVALIGGRVSLATLCRVENGKPISVNNLLTICEFLGIPPEHYCAEPDLSHVKRISETNEGRAA
ncbi:hypothetical protein ASD45_08420 [Pseudolabrys sp. Root1462]|uniref:helix-turn-helix domain-containing protein n=1 Tax=Pseudolabrys sp. Root1462 TaxID=1736466 RepID=UPI0007028505|nr:helix-turn-helix transcriptional regulator [Pseudolabrys sp. Root1462]KQZ00877.1 hypothetical protein ASD45_08420 [Pseudolabrys sp. Root1462]